MSNLSQQVNPRGLAQFTASYNKLKATQKRFIDNLLIAKFDQGPNPIHGIIVSKNEKGNGVFVEYLDCKMLVTESHIDVRNGRSKIIIYKIEHNPIDNEPEAKAETVILIDNLGNLYHGGESLSITVDTPEVIVLNYALTIMENER